MTKTELITNITNTLEKNGEKMAKAKVIAVLDALEVVTREAILKGESVTVPGICKIDSKIVAARTGIVMMGDNKGSTWTKPEHKAVTVKPVSTLKKVFE